MMTVRYRKVLLAASCLLLPGCLDLELPNVPADGGVGPTLTIHSPLEGQTISLNAPVSLDADSVNGVAAVTVTCGGAPSTGVFTWNVPRTPGWWTSLAARWSVAEWPTRAWRSCS